jgi:hypothetical protein
MFWTKLQLADFVVITMKGNHDLKLKEKKTLKKCFYLLAAHVYWNTFISRGKPKNTF